MERLWHIIAVMTCKKEDVGTPRQFCPATASVCDTDVTRCALPQRVSLVGGHLQAVFYCLGWFINICSCYSSLNASLSSAVVAYKNTRCSYSEGKGGNGSAFGEIALSSLLNDFPARRQIAINAQQTAPTDVMHKQAR
ncbi:hypothetical protein TRVL_04218 [Trypanosoma vivax]|nr:hypothetical protein TRVL_04218 [Trypanosoma vivax]